MNVKRRHLSPSQLGIIGAEIRKPFADAALKRMTAGKKDPDQNSGQVNQNAMADRQVAEIIGISHDTISRGIKVSENAPSLAAKVLTREISLHEAWWQEKP